MPPEDAAHRAQAFRVREQGNIDSHITNPTKEIFKKRVAVLEGGLTAVAASPGQAFRSLTIVALCRADDNIISSPNLYGGAYSQLKGFLPRMETTTCCVRSNSPEVFRRSIDVGTKLIFVEAMGDLEYGVGDLVVIAGVTHDAGVLFVIHSFFRTDGYFCRPIEYGADIVITGATHWAGAHDTMTIRIVNGYRRFDRGSEVVPHCFPVVIGSVQGFSGFNFWEEFSPCAFTRRLELDVIQDSGVCLDLIGADHSLSELETSSLRCKRRAQVTLALAQWLDGRGKVP